MSSGPSLEISPVRDLDISGPAKITFDNFDRAKSCFVRLQSNNQLREYELALYSDQNSTKPFRREVFNAKAIAGLDWGTYEKARQVMNCFHLPSQTSTYVTLVNQTNSITLLFPNDEGEKCNHWKNNLKRSSYLGSHYVREKMKYENKNVLLQFSDDNISLINTQKGSEPAKCAKSWMKNAFYTCDISHVSGSGSSTPATDKLMLILKSASTGRTETHELTCERGGFIDGQVKPKEEKIKSIKKNIMNVMVSEMFSADKIYDDINDYIYTDGSEYYDLNKVDPSLSSDYSKNQLPQTPGSRTSVIENLQGNDIILSKLNQIYMKVKNREWNAPAVPAQIDVQFDESEQCLANVGHIIFRISQNPLPHPPDTLNLPVPVREHICMSLYSNDLAGQRNDWTALASEIGIKQGVVQTISGYLANVNIRLTAAEIVIRHWQFTYNRYWDKPESEYPDRPKLPCTVEGLLQALKNIHRHDLVRHINDSEHQEYAVPNKITSEEHLYSTSTVQQI